MTEYEKFCTDNRDRIKFEFMRSINDETLMESYSIRSNVLCDGSNYYIADSMVNVSYQRRRHFRRRVGMIISIFGYKPRLSATDNSLGYTRLIYKF